MKITFNIPAEHGGARVDRALRACLPRYSRARLQKWIGQGRVTLDDKPCAPSDTARAGQAVCVNAPRLPEPLAEPECHAEDIPLNVVYQDEAIIVINKPAGLVTHPGAGNPRGTMQNALLFHFPDLAGLPRAGIVHRLDKDTSGLLVVSRNTEARESLIGQLQTRQMGREYEAVVCGVIKTGGTVDAPVGRHRVDRKRMAVRGDGRAARTHYRVAQKFRAHTHVRVKLESGRTHQIRVHLAYLNYPVLGDGVYGRRRKTAVPVAGVLPTRLIENARAFPRHALHAARLTLDHPQSGERMRWDAPLPDDLRGLLAALRACGR